MVSAKAGPVFQKTFATRGLAVGDFDNDGAPDLLVTNNGGSYLSSHDPREILGLSTAGKIEEPEIRWAAPSKRVDKFTNLEVNRYIGIVEGKGIS
jgi:hypothetical protein